MSHTFERGPGYCIGLGGSRHPLVISHRRRIMHEHMISVATEGKNPVGSASGNHVITRNEDDDHASRIQCPHENRFAHRSQVGGDTERLRITLERELRYLHEASLVVRLRRYEVLQA